MRFEIVLIVLTGIIVGNIYTEGKLVRKLLSFKKYYQMMGVVFGAFLLYWLFRKNPEHAKQILVSSNEYLKYMPVDRNTADMITPILDMTQNHMIYNDRAAYQNPVLDLSNPGRKKEAIVGTKRNVSESKKKIVASRQNWKCSLCGDQLSYNYQIDHIVRLQYGGSNHLDNLTALCPDCHSKKTIMENLQHNESSI
jgi:hypothetical protein